MDRGRLSDVSGIALILSGIAGAAFTFFGGALTFPVLFLTVAVFGFGTHTDSYRITILSLAVGACAAVLTAGVRFVYYDSFDLLIVTLVVLATVMGWKAVKMRNVAV